MIIIPRQLRGCELSGWRPPELSSPVPLDPASEELRCAVLGMVALLLVTMVLLLPATRQEPLSPRAISEIKFALQEEYRTRVTQFLEVCLVMGVFVSLMDNNKV